MEVLFEDETDKSSDGGEEWNTMFSIGVTY